MKLPIIQNICFYVSYLFAMSAKTVSDSTTDIESNKKWKAYAFIGIVSFINFVSIADVLGVEDAREFFAIEKSKTVSLMFGIV